MKRLIPAIVVVVLFSMTTHGKPSSSGDEPHYLMVSQSLLADGDLDLANNYAQNDGRLVGHDGLVAGPHARVTRTGSLWTTHDIGLSVMLVPAQWLGSALASQVSDQTLARLKQSRGRFSYGIVSFFLICLTAWGAAMLFAGLSGIAPARDAAIVTLVLVLSPPVLVHGFLVFPEAPAFVITCAVVWLACRPTAMLMLRVALPVVFALGVMPWFHRKYSFYAVGLLFVLWHRHRDWVAQLPESGKAMLGTAFVLPQLALHVTTLVAWGQLGGPQMLESLPFSLQGGLTGAAGLLIDRSRGLLAYAPVYLIVPAGWWFAGRPHRDLVVPILLLFLPMAAFVTWGAGYSPAARHLVPLTALLAVPLAPALGHKGVRRAGVVLLVFQLLISGYGWQHPRALWPGLPGTNAALSWIPWIGPAYMRLLPVLDNGTWLQ